MTIINILLLITMWNIVMSKSPTHILWCGIVGFSGKSNFNKDKIIQLMMWNSFARGLDSTGIYSPKNKLIKKVEAAPMFLLKNKIIPDNMLMVHMRAATVGSKDLVDNAHPFKIGNITLLHNGTLINHWGILRKNRLTWADYNVDSQVICGAIDKQQNFNVLREIDGGAAFLINDDRKPNVLYVYRNNERPLFKGTFDGDMYISSIEEALKLIGCINIKSFKENVLYVIKDGAIIDKLSIIPKPFMEYNKIVHETFSSQHYFGTHLELRYKVNQKLSLNKLYLIEGFNNKDMELTITNDVGEIQLVNKHAFILDSNCITVGKIVESLVELTYKKQILCAADDILMVLEDYLDGRVKVRAIKTGIIFTCGKKHLSRIPKFKEDLLEEESKDNDLKDINFPEIEDLNIETDDLELNINEDNKDSILNEDELIDDLAKIEDKSLKLFNYAFNHSSKEDQNNLKEMYNDLDNCFEETSKKYIKNLENV